MDAHVTRPVTILADLIGSLDLAVGGIHVVTTHLHQIRHNFIVVRWLLSLYERIIIKKPCFVVSQFEIHQSSQEGKSIQQQQQQRA